MGGGSPGAVLAIGAGALERLLEDVCCGRRDEAVECACAERMQSRGVKEKESRTILGPLTLRRTMFQRPACGATRLPGDEALNVVNTSFSPGLRRMMSRAGGNTPFKEAAEDLRIYAGVGYQGSVSAGTVWPGRTVRDFSLCVFLWRCQRLCPGLSEVSGTVVFSVKCDASRLKGLGFIGLISIIALIKCDAVFRFFRKGAGGSGLFRGLFHY